MRNYTPFVDVIRTLISYANNYEDAHNIPIVDSQDSDTVKDIIPTYLLTRERQQTYMRYARIAKLTRRHKELPDFFKNLFAWVYLRITFLDMLRNYFRLNGKRSKVVLLLVHWAHQYINNPNKAPIFQDPYFWKADLSAFSHLREIYDAFVKTAVPPFRALMETTYKGHSNVISVGTTIIHEHPAFGAIRNCGNPGQDDREV